jgi:hypothetical protein
VTGPEHYQQAENLIANVTDREVTAQVATSYAAVAQVHATLALAAATAEAFVPSIHYQPWREVTP